MKLWRVPHVIKVYEALGIIADNRIKVKGNEAKVLSSNRDKTYTVIYDPAKNTIVANDLGSFWQRYLSYPSIAYLLETGILSYDKKISAQLKGIEWKNINDKYKHNYAKVIEVVNEKLKDSEAVSKECQRILKAAMALKLKQPEKLIRPS